MIHKLGNRTDDPAYFDMSGRFPPSPQCHWYGRGFRMGDRAVAHVLLQEWRNANPSRKLTLIEDSTWPECGFSRHLSGVWLGGGLVDEVIVISGDSDIPPPPSGEPLYVKSLGESWHRLRNCACPAISLRPLPEWEEAASAFLRNSRVGPKYVVIQPLLTATVNRFRNGKVLWWNEVISAVTRTVPTVVCATSDNMAVLKPRGRPTLAVDLHPGIALALIAKSSAFLGAETGFTLWAPLFHIPTAAAYRAWVSKPSDWRPLSFGKPVVWVPLDGMVRDAATKLVGLCHGTIRRNIP